jgi:hypothetical protein
MRFAIGTLWSVLEELKPMSLDSLLVPKREDLHEQIGYDS